MIDLTLQIVLLIGIAAYFYILVYLLKKKQLTLKYTLFWIFAGILMLILTIFPQILTFFADLVGFDVPANALFTVILFCVIVSLMILTAIVSKLHDQTTRLTQALALLEKRVRDLEKKSDDTTGDDEDAV